MKIKKIIRPALNKVEFFKNFIRYSKFYLNKQLPIYA